MIKSLALLIVFGSINISTFAVADECQTGKISWYGKEFNGRLTANGERFDENKLTAASNNISMGSTITVTNLENKYQVKLTVNDTGGFHKYNRVLDVSKGAASRLDMLKSGTTTAQICICRRNK